MAYSIYSLDAIFMEKFAKQNCRFLEFSKNQKNGDFVQQNLALRLRLLYFSWCLTISIFCWLCRDIQLFFCRCHIYREICKTKLPFFGIFKKYKKQRFCTAKFCPKDASMIFSWCLSISIFRWLCRGIQHLFCRCNIG